MKTTLKFAFVLGLALSTTGAFAQSLADVAKKEEARRGVVRKPSKTYTNGDLVPDTNPAPAPAPATVSAPPSASLAAAAPSGNASPAGEAAAAPGAAGDKEEPLDEARWRRRAAAMKARIQKARDDVGAFAGPTHPDKREQVKIEALLVRAKANLARAEAAQADFVKEAAAAKVPPAWIQ